VGRKRKRKKERKEFGRRGWSEREKKASGREWRKITFVPYKDIILKYSATQCG
jgi:hypothetical protein